MNIKEKYDEVCSEIFRKETLLKISKQDVEILTNCLTELYQKQSELMDEMDQEYEFDLQ